MCSFKSVITTIYWQMPVSYTHLLIDWIPMFEDKQVDYDIDIPEQPIRVRLDVDSYMRIINNLIQNVIARCV